MAHFFRKLKCVSRKYKGKLPFKCFECRRVGHFTSKCTYKEISKKDNDQNPKVRAYKYLKNKSFKKKGIYSKEDNST